MYDDPSPQTCGGSALNSLADYGPKECKEPTCRQQLDRKKSNLVRQLAEIEEALKALDDNPEIERVLTLVGRTVRF